MRTRWMALLGVVAVLGCGDGDHEAEKNLSRGLVSFQYFLTAGLGFCAQSGWVYRAEIRSPEDGTLTVAGSVLESGVTGRDDCLPEVSFGTCWVARSIPGRVLTARESEAVAAAFKDVKIKTEDESDCSFADPCLVRRFTWTNAVAQQEVSVGASNGSCAPRLSDADAQSLTGLVASLLLGTT
ncbi:MAG: hypothetical protein ABIR79_08485 [Candidatus Binatia bacterium]